MVAFCCRNSVSMLGAFAELFSAAIPPWFARHAGGCLESLRCAAGIRRRRSWFLRTARFLRKSQEVGDAEHGLGLRLGAGLGGPWQQAGALGI